jgi:hypothetical protein
LGDIELFCVDLFFMVMTGVDWWSLFLVWA